MKIDKPLKVDKRVVVTGVGVITTLGESLPAVSSAMKEARSGLSPIRDFDISPYSCSISGRYADFDVVPYLGSRGIRKLNRCTRMLLAAAVNAFKDGKIEIDNESEEDVGAVVATNFGVEASVREMEQILFNEGALWLSPLTSFNGSVNAAASQISIHFKAKACNITVPSGFSAGIEALGLARNLIAGGRARAVLVGGAEEIPEGLFREYDQQGLLAPSAAGMIPFARESQGMILGDGAAALLIEDLDHALSRGADIYGEAGEILTAYHPGCDFSGPNFSRPRMKAILEQVLTGSIANRVPVDLIMSSANGAPDEAEWQTYCDLLPAGTPVCNIKSFFGEGFSFTNVLQIALALSALKHQNAAVTHILDGSQSGGCQAGPAVNRQYRSVIIGSLGLDGTQAAAIVNQYQR